MMTKDEEKALLAKIEKLLGTEWEEIKYGYNQKKKGSCAVAG